MDIQSLLTIIGAIIDLMGLVFLGVKFGDMFVSERKFDKYTEHVDSRFDKIENKVSNIQDTIVALAHRIEEGGWPEEFLKKIESKESC